MNAIDGKMTGKVCMVTGANSGIGLATSQELAKRGAHVIMICRDHQKGEIARSEIISESKNEAVAVMSADLSSQSSIRALVSEFNTQYSALHVLINNAGAIKSQRTVTSEGLESTFATNHLGHFLLTNLLLEILKASAPARIINVSSSHHAAGKMNFDDLQGEQKYNMTTAYCQSKLANVLFTYELAKRLQGTGVTVNCLHPGATRSNFSDGLEGLWALLWKLSDPLRSSPSHGAETPVYLATSPEVAMVSGQYFIRKKPAASSKASHNEQDAKKLWQVSAELTHLQ